MTGNSQQYQLNQTRIDRRAQSLNLANNQKLHSIFKLKTQMQT